MTGVTSAAAEYAANWVRRRGAHQGGRMIREGGALLSAARHLTPWIAEHAQSFERARRLPASVIEQLRELGVFRLFVPRMYGGLECWQEP